MKIQPTKDYLLLISGEALKAGDIGIFPNTFNGEILSFEGCVPLKVSFDYASNDTYNFKVLAYYPLTSEAKELDLPLLPKWTKDTNTIYLVDNLKGGEEGNLTWNVCAFESQIDAEKYCEGEDHLKWYSTTIYKTAQEKKFTIEDMKKTAQAAFTVKSNNDNIIEDFEKWFDKRIKSLSTQQYPKEFIPEYDNTMSMLDISDEYPFEYEIKTTSNPEGKQELMGKYIY